MKILICGYGRLGKTFKKILPEADIYSENTNVNNYDVVIMCVPREAYNELLPKFKNLLIVDCSSVKEEFKAEKYLIIHPLFGENILPYFSNIIVIDYNCKEAEEFLKLLEKRGLKLIKMSKEEHDKIMSKNQGVLHFITMATYNYLSEPDTAFSKTFKILAKRLLSQNPSVIYDIRKSSEEEIERFLGYLKEFYEKTKDFEEFKKPFEYGDYSFLLNCAKIYENPKTLEEYRQYISLIDDLILKLLEIRTEKVKEIAKIKQEMNLPIEIPEIEERKINNILSSTNLNKLIVKEIFEKILELSKKTQEEILGIRYKVGVLGPIGTFSDECALQIFKSRNYLVYFKTIEEVFEAVQNGKVNYGVVPIENTYGGTVIPTIECLIKYDVFVVGEKEIQIRHCLVAKKNLSYKEIKVLYSHPQAITQCKNFIKNYLPHVEIKYTNSTVEALTLLDENSAAISSETAALLNNCVILKKDIQDSSANITRFYVISKEKTDGNITALFFSVEDRPGALKDVLEVFYKYNINLRKLESRPDKQRPGKYIFFTEAESKLNDEIIENLKKKTIYLKIVGSFNKI